MSRGFKKRTISPSDLHKIGEPYPWPEPPGWGLFVQLNSGSPILLIVDIEGEFRVCAYVDNLGVAEISLNWRCLKPVV